MIPDTLPLAVTMIVGPGLIADVVLITAPRPVRVSAAFVLGVTLATAAGVVVALNLASLLGTNVELGDPSDWRSIGNAIQYVVVALLAAAAIWTYARRKEIRTPKWMGELQNADPRRAFVTGALLIWMMPADLIIMFTVGVNLVHHDASVVAALPFVAATALVAALPLLAYVLFRGRAQRLMPRVRDWMNKHSWLVNIVTYIVFILLILS